MPVCSPKIDWRRSRSWLWQLPKIVACLDLIDPRMNRLLIIDAVSTKKMLAHFSGVYDIAPAERVRLYDKTTSRPRWPVHGPARAVPSATLNRRGTRTGQRDPATGPRSPSRTLTPKQVHRKERHHFPGRPLHEQPTRRHRVTHPEAMTQRTQLRSVDTVHSIIPWQPQTTPYYNHSPQLAHTSSPLSYITPQQYFGPPDNSAHPEHKPSS